MVYTLLNHIQGKKGSRWAQFASETGTDYMLMVAIDAAKYTHKAIICTFYGDVLVQPLEFDALLTGVEKIENHIQIEKELLGMKEVVMRI